MKKEKNPLEKPVSDLTCKDVEYLISFMRNKYKETGTGFVPAGSIDVKYLCSVVEMLNCDRGDY